MPATQAARLLDLGLRPYREVWELQHRLHEAVREGREPDTWIVVEHTPTVTLGRQAKRENVLLSAMRWRRAASTWWRSSAAATSPITGPASSSSIRFGGCERFREVVPLVRALEGAVIDACARFGVSAGALGRARRRLGRPQSDLRGRPGGAERWFRCTASRSTSRPSSATTASSSRAGCPTGASPRCRRKPGSPLRSDATSSHVLLERVGSRFRHRVPTAVTTITCGRRMAIRDRFDHRAPTSQPPQHVRKPDWLRVSLPAR